jgi:hypothetical protein
MLLTFRVWLSYFGKQGYQPGDQSRSSRHAQSETRHYDDTAWPMDWLASFVNHLRGGSAVAGRKRGTQGQSEHILAPIEPTIAAIAIWRGQTQNFIISPLNPQGALESFPLCALGTTQNNKCCIGCVNSRCIQRDTSSAGNGSSGREHSENGVTVLI